MFFCVSIITFIATILHDIDIYTRYINKKTLPNIRIYLTIKTLLSLIIAYCQNTLYVMDQCYLE